MRIEEGDWETYYPLHPDNVTTYNWLYQSYTSEEYNRDPTEVEFEIVDLHHTLGNTHYRNKVAKLIDLPEKDIETLVEGINNPPQPNEELKKATEIYREISDEEIKKGIKREWNYSSAEQRSWMRMGAEWYREQLKQRK